MKSYYLENVAKSYRLNPRHVVIPTDGDIKKLKVNDQVKLVFMFHQPLENGCTAERMWVELLEINGTTYKGCLMNRPSFITDSRIGDVLEFTNENIAQLMTIPTFDEDKKLIITKRALENREVNWLLRDEPLNDEDSGWQLFYGDEDEAYTDDAKNATMVTLNEVLTFEPRLALAFESQHHAFEWDEASMNFTEVHDFQIE